MALPLTPPPPRLPGSPLSALPLPLTWKTLLWCRDGLFARPGTSDQLQVSVDPGTDFDLDTEIDGLRGQLGRLKDVRPAHPLQSLAVLSGNVYATLSGGA